MVNILPTYPKAIMDLIEGLGRTVTGKLTGDGGGGGTSAAREAVQRQLSIDSGLTDSQRAALVGWMQGADLSDPLLIEWVNRVTGGGGPVPGTGRLVAPGAGAGAVSAANDNGIGGGGSQGNAALASVPGTPQAQAARPAVPAVPGLPTAGGSTTPTLPSVAPTNTAPKGMGEGDASRSEALIDNAGGITARLAGRSAGVDIDQGGLAAQYFQKASNPVIESLLKLMAYVPGGGTNGNIDPTNTANVIAQVAKMFTTPGADPYAWARQQAQQLVGNADFMNNFGGMDEPGQRNALEALFGFKGAGASPLKANAMAQQMKRGMGEYNDRELGMVPGSKYNQYGGNIANFFATPEGQKFASVFGILPK